MQVLNVIETRLFHLDPHDKTPGLGKGSAMHLWRIDWAPFT